jgi:hypothetical protein
MNTKSKKILKNSKNKTKKLLLPSVPVNVNVNYYNSHYKNTQLIPNTLITNYILNNFNDYLSYKKLCDAMDNYTLTLEECFIIDDTDLPNGLRKNEIDLSLKMNSKTPLDKFIAYSFYMTQSSILKNKTSNETLELLKYQMGKDISRTERYINGKLYNQHYYITNDRNGNDRNNYEVADLFYQNIIDYMYKVNKNINLNIVNKFALLSCQNLFNLITDMITIKINKMLEPETNSVFRPTKYINIIINKNEFSMEFNFKSKLVISRDGEPMDPSYPCGDLDLVFYIELRKNYYEIKKLNISYDIEKCGPEKEETTDEIIEKGASKFNIKSEYAIPAGLITAGIIATPILLSTLGGNKKIKKNFKKKNRTRKYRTKYIRKNK